uniref:Ig-like domain-containing protein n=1 Tax=Gopherus agassizii TaxID=38772 RepID=A0A452IQI0_9SAUR
MQGQVALSVAPKPLFPSCLGQAEIAEWPIYSLLTWLLFNNKFVDATVKLTNNMNLECVYPKTDGITQMSWVKSIVTGKEVIAVSHPLYGVHIEDKYKDRVRFINAFSRDKSLNFMKTTEADTGLYLCSITFPNGVWEKVVQVIQLDSFEVPVPPTNHMIIEPGGNVTLRCSYSVGDLVRQVMWERIKCLAKFLLIPSAEGHTKPKPQQKKPKQ